MPIYSCVVRGAKKPRIVKADSAAQARDHVVEAKALTAVQLADLIADGAEIEKAGEEPKKDPDPAPAGD